jgi:twitching motility protein PilT
VTANNPVRALIREGKTHQIRNVVSTNAREGMQTMEVALNGLVEQGLISYDDAVARSQYPREIKGPAPVPVGATR